MKKIFKEFGVHFCAATILLGIWRSSPEMESGSVKVVDAYYIRSEFEFRVNLAQECITNSSSVSIDRQGFYFKTFFLE